MMTTATRPGLGLETGAAGTASPAVGGGGVPAAAPPHPVSYGVRRAEADVAGLLRDLLTRVRAVQSESNCYLCLTSDERADLCGEHLPRLMDYIAMPGDRWFPVRGGRVNLDQWHRVRMARGMA